MSSQISWEGEGVPLPPRTALITDLLNSSSTHNEIQSFMSDEDRSRLVSAKERLSASLNRVEARLTRLRAELDATLTERAVVARDLHDLRLILNPVHTIPAELLQGIFLMVLHLEDESQEAPFFSHDSFDVKKAPWTFTHVCRGWRSAAIGFAPLWTKLGLYLRSQTPGPVFEAFSSLLELQIKRSGHRSLVVSLHGQNWSNVEPGGHLLRLLSNSATRWHSLNINLTPKMAMHLYPLGQFLSCLEVLHLDLQVEGRATLPDRVFPMFADVPQLIEVRGSPEHLRCFHLPWDRIQSVILKYLGDGESVLFTSPSNFASHETMFSNMAHVKTMHVAILPAAGVRLTEPIVFRFLTKLEILRPSSLSTESNTTDLLRDITAPNLEYFHIELSQMTAPIEAIAEFLSRSRCRLQICRLTFVTHIFRLPTSDIAPIFRLCEYLKDLQLDRFKFVMPATEHESYPRFTTRLITDPTFLPNLRVLASSPEAIGSIPVSERAELLELRPLLRLEPMRPTRRPFRNFAKYTSRLHKQLSGEGNFRE